MSAKTIDRVALRFLVAREHSSPEALKEYLRRHPKADPKKHTVKPSKSEEKAPEGEKKPERVYHGDGDGLETLKSMGPGQKKRLLEQALEDLDAEEKGRAPKKMKDVSKMEGFEGLKDLSHSEQQKVIEKALKDL